MIIDARVFLSEMSSSKCHYHYKDNDDNIDDDDDVAMSWLVGMENGYSTRVACSCGLDDASGGSRQIFQYLDST